MSKAVAYRSPGEKLAIQFVQAPELPQEKPPFAKRGLGKFFLRV